MYESLELNPYCPKEVRGDLIEPIRKKISRTACFCHGNLLKGKIMVYDHDNGWLLPGYQKPQWIFVECPKCHHQWSMNKLMEK
jgi:hypothetical protein